jgi:hypothetical protein
MRVSAALAALAPLCAAGCGGVSTALTVDDSIEIVEPLPMEVVDTPFTVRWTGGGDAASSFAVFVDRHPVAPGRSIDAGFEDECEGIPGCPDDAVLASRGIYRTNNRELTLPLVAPAGGVDGASALEVHRATIVVVDAQGVRRGERAWTTEFRVRR